MVNVTATVAEVADSGTPAALAALTKGGLVAVTKSLASEYAPYGIRVNAVSPCSIQPLVHAAENGEGIGGRPGHVRDVVDGVMFLESSPEITGEILHIDGGQVTGHRSHN